MLEKYRKTMTHEVLHSWAADAQAEIDRLRAELAAPKWGKPLADAQIESGREATFSTGNPFCPCDSKTMRKVVRWAEREHGIAG